MLFHIDPLRLWVHKVLPVVYDDSLSYYEVLAKVTKKLNEVIDLTEEQNQYIEEFSTNLTNAINHWEDGMEQEWSKYKNDLNNEWTDFQKNTEQYIENWKNMAESDIEDAIAAGINQFVSYFSDLTQTAVDAAEEAMRAAENAAQDAVDAVMPTLENQFDERYAWKTAVGSPLVATTAAGMTDTTKVYVYAGSETGYVNGDWYYYDGTAWQDGGVYNSAAVVTDPTLSESGVPADAKAAGDEIADLKNAFKNSYPIETVSGDVVTFETLNGGMGLDELKVDITPVQSGAGDPSPENIRPITGFDKCQFIACGKNLYNLQDYTEAGWTRQADDEYTDKYYGNKPRFCDLRGKVTTDPDALGLLPMRKNFGITTVSFYKYGAGNLRVYCHYSNGGWVNRSGNIDTVGYQVWSSNAALVCDGAALYTTQGSSSTATLAQLQLEIGSTRTAYEPFKGTSASVSFGEAGTVYGGHLDVLNGVLTVTHGEIASYAGETLPGKWISSMDVYAEGATPTTGAQVVYELETPVEYQVTPVEVVTQSGINHVFADTGDVEVSYRADYGTLEKRVGICETAIAGNTDYDMLFAKYAIEGKIPAKKDFTFESGGITSSGDNYNGDAAYNAITKRTSSYITPICNEGDIIFFESLDPQLLAVRVFVYNDNGFVRDLGYQRAVAAIRHISGYKYRVVYQVYQPDVDSVDVQTVYDNCLIYYKARPLSKNILTPAKDTYAIMTYNVGQWYNGTGDPAPITTEYNDLRMQFDAIQRQIIDKYTPDVLCIQEYYGNYSLIAKNYNNSQYYNPSGGNLYSAKTIATNYDQSDITGVLYTRQATSVKTNYAYTYIDLGGRHVCVIDTHLTLGNTSDSVSQMTELKAFADTQDYVIICGDFNANIHNPDVYTAVYKPWEDDGYHLINTPDFGKRLQDESLQAIDNVITSGNITIKYGFCDYTKESLPYADRDHMPVIAYVTIS